MADSDRMRLSARGFHRVLKLARTLADLDAAEKVGRIHLAEALSYRSNADRQAQAALVSRLSRARRLCQHATSHCGSLGLPIRNMIRYVLAAAFALALAAPASPVEILKKVPGRGQIKAGNSVFVDDGKCPSGQISQVFAGAGSGDSGNAHAAAGRTRKCVARPY